MLLNFVKLVGLQLSGRTISCVEIFLGGHFQGGNFPGGSYPWWEFSLVGVFRVGIIRWESSGQQFSGWEFSCYHINNASHLNSHLKAQSEYTLLIKNRFCLIFNISVDDTTLFSYSYGRESTANLCFRNNRCSGGSDPRSHDCPKGFYKSHATGETNIAISCSALILKMYRQKQPAEVFHKKVFLKISQNSQENTFVGLSF